MTQSRQGKLATIKKTHKEDVTNYSSKVGMNNTSKIGVNVINYESEKQSRTKAKAITSFQKRGSISPAYKA